MLATKMRKLQKSGFTFVETILSASIFLILAASLFAVMNVGGNSWFTSDASTELRQEIIKTFIRMEKELKGIRPSQTNLAYGDNSVSLTFKITQDNNADGTILDASGNVEWSGDITYALNGSNQIMRTASGQTTVMAGNIVSLQFSRPNGSPTNLLQVDVTAQKIAITGRTVRDTGQIKIKMRN